MAHNLLAIDGQYAFTETNDRLSAWHGLGNFKTTPRTAEEALGDLPYIPTCAEAPIGYTIDGEWCSYAGKKALFGLFPKSRVEYGVVDNAYPVLQHTAFAGAWDRGGGLKVATAGILEPGSRLFLCGALKAVNVAGDIVDAYLSAVNDQSGSGTNALTVSTVRVVCQNTLNVAMAATDFAAKVNVVHKGVTPDQLLQLMTDEFRGIVERAHKTVEEFEAKANTLATLSITDAQAMDIFGAAFVTPARPRTNAVRNEVMVAREASWEARTVTAEANRAVCMDLYRSGNDTIKGIAGTAWGAVNAVTECVDHLLPERGDLAKVSATKVLGYKADMKSRAWAAAVALL